MPISQTATGVLFDIMSNHSVFTLGNHQASLLDISSNRKMSIYKELQDAGLIVVFCENENNFYSSFFAVAANVKKDIAQNHETAMPYRIVFDGEDYDVEKEYLK